MKRTYFMMMLMALLWMCIPQAKADDFELTFRHNRSSNILTESVHKLTFTAKTTVEAEIAIYVGSEKIASASNATELKETYEFANKGDYEIKAVASANGQTAEKSLYVAYVDDSKAASDTTVPALGVTRNSNGSYTFGFAAPEKTSVMLVGSWNGYRVMNAQNLEYVDVTDNGYSLRYFKLTLPKETVGDSFMYYYMIDGKTAVADPYARLVLDPYNDSYIGSDVYPNMPEYPEDLVPSNTVISIYGDKLLDYSWQCNNFKPAAKENLIIYEMLFRDFTGTEGASKGNGTVRSAMEKISYLKELGVNAVELLPINEFNGNNSWGYNPNFYFAPDKAYGTPQDYKEFIDLCHQNGIAVILDVVFNQSDWLHPWYKMYSSGSNPFYNATAPHAYSVLNDWNQGYPLVEQQWKDMLRFWLSEYKVDGFRFDLVKGLGDNDSYKNSGDSATSAYNQSRVDRMIRLHAAMSEVNPDAYFINENLSTASEENAMAADGQMNWANCNNAGCQFAMGYSSDSNLTRTNAVKDSNRLAGSTVSYLESHDEQRLGYKQDMWGVDGVKDNLAVSMQRCGSAAAQLILVPGAHMIWQFSEMGNDENTKDSSGNNNTSPKKVNWSALDNEYNKGLVDSYSEMIHLRLANPELFNDNSAFTNSCGGWSKGRYIKTYTDSKELYCLINPNAEGDLTFTVDFKTNNNNDYYIASKSYESNPSYDASAKTVTVEPGCYVVVSTNNVTAVKGIAADAADAVRVYSVAGGIRVAGANGQVEVYTLDGRRVAASRVSGEATLSVAPGLYAVRCAGKSAKVLVK
jgi:1,4-alpha-glucan branching enzyme